MCVLEMECVYERGRDRQADRQTERMRGSDTMIKRQRVCVCVCVSVKCSKSARVLEIECVRERVYVSERETENEWVET